MAGRSHQQLRFWALIVLALVATVIAGGHLWKRQLPERLRQAFRAGDLLACMHYSEQLTALQWLNPDPPRELALCRRAMALRHWQNGDPAAALALQQDLINSSSEQDLLQQQDQRQLLRWRNELLSKAMSAFKTGEIDAAIRLLEPLDAKDATAGGKLSDQWKESWERNRLEHQRLQRLVKQESWWEALGSLNRLDQKGGGSCHCIHRQQAGTHQPWRWPHPYGAGAGTECSRQSTNRARNGGLECL